MTDNLLTEHAKPDHVPEKFWNNDTGEIRIEALLNSYKELERKMSGSLPNPETREHKLRVQKALGMPETADEYCIDCSHGMFEPDADVNARLHQKGLTQDQIQEVYDLAAEKLVPMISELYMDFQADREVEKLINHFGGVETWKRVSKQLAAFGKQNLAPDVFQNLSSSYEGVLALYRMMKSEEPGLQKSQKRLAVKPMSWNCNP